MHPDDCVRNPSTFRQKRWLPLFASLPLLFAAVPACVAQNQSPGNTTADSTLAQWRQQYASGLQAPDGWLSLVALQWLADGETSVGSGTGNKLVLKNLPEHALVIQQQSGKASLVGTPASCIRVNGAPAHPQSLAPDESGTPDVLTCGSVQMTIIHRGDRLYLRVKDSKSPTRTHFAGLHWYPANPAARVTAKWVPYPSPQTLRITNVLGQTSEEQVAGYVEFALDGHTAKLTPLAEGDSLFFILRDETSRTDTYQAGRFLTAALPDHGLNQPGTVVLDFNRAYNPPCAYTAYATCPLPPQENRLAFSIPAGEKRFHD